MKKKHSFKRFINEMESLFAIGSIFVFLFSISGFLNKESLFLDLFSHFRVQYLVISFFCICIFSFRKKYLILFFSILSFVLNAISIYPYLSYFNPDAKQLVGKSKLTFMVSNVLTSNDKYAEVIKSYRHIDPDFLVVLEIDKNWEESLEVLEELYPYSKRLPRKDNFGIGLFSKYPFKEAKIKTLGENVSPIVVAKVEVENQSISIIGVHPVPPISESYFKERNQFFRLLSSFVSKLSEPVVVMGDFNSTMWSYSFRSFIRSSSLKDIRKGEGIIPTWPSQLPIFYVPLEHILANSSWQLEKLYSRKVKGSDHLALVAELQLLN